MRAKVPRLSMYRNSPEHGVGKKINDESAPDNLTQQTHYSQ
ncbi:hypothetical protein L618_004200000130 [Rhodococcus rhodochrous J45]|uniref:Uncharacterized protein n=1 Tax=Rhodococcus rhodochrous J45 TaxID=935266 RepID=A0A562DL29_RHORH|nr:hypothetical protein L618_004200000130 [Rhodococcus rhodochrous J45]